MTPYPDPSSPRPVPDTFNPVRAGWIAFAIAVVPYMLLSYFWIPFACVMFFVLFVLAIVALVKGRVAGGVMLLLALAIGGPLASLVLPLVPLMVTGGHRPPRTNQTAAPNPAGPNRPGLPDTTPGQSSPAP